MKRFNFNYRGYHADGGLCQIDIYRPKRGIPVIIATELDENHNTSVTNIAEYLAAEVVAQQIPEADGMFVWIEHYVHKDKSTYDMVVFEHKNPVAGQLLDGQGKPRPSYGTPTWLPLTKEQVEILVKEKL
jgi:hypothetical protein